MAPFLKLLLGGGAAFISPKASSWNSATTETIIGGTISTSSYSTSQLLASSSQTSTTHNQDQQANLAEVISLLGGSPTNLLRLDSTTEGVRGVYLNENVSKGDVLLEIPLASCLRDDGDPPSWLIDQQDTDNKNNNAYSPIQIQGWVTRLAAQLLQLQSRCEEGDKNKNMVDDENESSLPSEGLRAWLKLLPESLRDSLPIYWPEEVIKSTDCRPLELAVDAAFFARAAPLSDLAASGKSQAQVERALDLVQTRACRCATWEETNSDESLLVTGTPAVVPSSRQHSQERTKADLRVMVPIFDMINHSYEHNAEFFRKGDYMIVRAKQDLTVDEEVLISYGASSTTPIWRCLFSYGFVPSVDDIYEYNVVEIALDDYYRFEVSPTEIPFELVQYQAKKQGIAVDNPEDIEFTPEIGKAIVEQLRDCAKRLEVSQGSRGSMESRIRSTDSMPQETMELINLLKESHRRTLLACAGGLQEYLENE
ncbi:unnamed protein product [Cylindrotheca closterium]|uniref:SET domain-containing protein n=1 Tax=Cylindrotheca closterium TaxID=2856 RepID=A0AAD2FKL2_9STRA|nr:unnamed protein product [Cylindrotheca closterium]